MFVFDFIVDRFGSFWISDRSLQELKTGTYHTGVMPIMIIEPLIEKVDLSFDCGETFFNNMA